MIRTMMVTKIAYDEFKPEGREFHVGLVVGTVTDDCGASADDPLFILQFPDGRRDGFWKEELVRVPEGFSPEVG